MSGRLGNRQKVSKHRQKVGGIHKDVGGKTVDGVPCLSFSAQITTATADRYIYITRMGYLFGGK